jgi:hypothetical protein
VHRIDMAHGFVVGSWQQPDEGGGPRPTPYRARLGTMWNGFENPYFNRETTDRVIADQAALVESLPPDRRVGLYTFAWDGNTLLIENKMPRPGTASAEEADRPGRIAPVVIDGQPHWNIGLGWSWEQVCPSGEPVSTDPTVAQINARTRAEEMLGHIRETLVLQLGLRRHLDDRYDVFPVTAHLGDYADRAHRPIPVHVPIGRVMLAPDGTAVLQLEYGGEVASAALPHID